MKHILLLIGLLISPFLVTYTYATHIVGGDINMQCLNPKEPGNYKITVSLYFDDLNGSLGALDNSITITIFRKSDNKRMLDIPINLTDRNPVIYTNPACATLRSLKTSVLRYIKVIELLPKTYDDPAGYYIVWERCCRNNDIDNIFNAKWAGMVFYVEFPPLIHNDKPFVNSTPVFQQLNGEYVCRNEVFEINYDAVDLDGDVLKYTLVTPYNGFTTPDRIKGQDFGSSDYPPVVWTNGSDVNNQIPGNPSLTVHPQKGVLNVKASSLGLHVISVLCEEFRNGVRIGGVRRDFQFLVVDCANNVPAQHTISLGSQPTATEVTFCEGIEVELKGNDPKADWNYQWQRNGDNISGATQPILLTKEEGDYVVVASFKTVCGKTKTASNKIKIIVTKERTKLQYKGKAQVCGNGQSFQLKALANGRSSYSWFFNGDLMPTEKNQIINVVKEGAYAAIIKNLDTDCIAKSDTVYVDVVKNKPVVSLIPASQIDNRCEGDSVLLNATITKGFIYEWKKDNQRFDSTLRANTYIKTSGIYTVSITDSNECVANSANITVTFYKKPEITLDSIPPICLTDKLTPISVNITPQGGILSGNGINGKTFDPIKAGVGNHTITYTYRGVVSCQNGSIKRIIKVNSPPNASLIPAGQINNRCEGDSVLLNTTASKGFIYEWKKDNQQIAINLRSNTYVKTSGDYAVSITDSNKCTTNSTNIAITFYKKQIITLDSIPPMCFTDKLKPIPLNISPQGGVLAGNGIYGKTFDPIKAGVGNHTITYSYKGVVECQNESMKRIVYVNKTPHTNLIQNVVLFKGTPYTLNSEATDATIFKWSPTNYLDNPRAENPVTRPEKTILYILTATNEWGCVYMDSTLVKVVQNILIPDIFTPNNDSNNDYWDLKFFEKFPDLEVSIYNRWGELVFFSKGYNDPFDGTYKGEKLPTGSYVYTIKPAKDLPIFQGGLTIMY
jgi:gliding motility-associated-like protein